MQFIYMKMVKTTVGLTLTKLQLNAHFFTFFVDNSALPFLAQTTRLGSWVFHHANFLPSFIFCTRPDLARGRARQACPILVYCDRISGRATSRCIVHGRCETEDWPDSVRIRHDVIVSDTAALTHTERTIRSARITGNCPF